MSINQNGNINKFKQKMNINWDLEEDEGEGGRLCAQSFTIKTLAMNGGESYIYLTLPTRYITSGSCFHFRKVQSDGPATWMEEARASRREIALLQIRLIVVHEFRPIVSEL